ncbi:unnamed protein product, partial [Iphiclides podalirius]
MVMKRNSEIFLIALLFIGTKATNSLPKCRMPNGYAGECRHLEKCKPLFDLNEKQVKTDLDLLYLRQSSCGTTSSYRYKVCCPPQTEWSKALDVNPVLYPELMDDVAKYGQSSTRKYTTPTQTTSNGNNDNTNRVGQIPTKRPAPANSNNKIFDNNYLHSVGQNPTNGQVSVNANNIGSYNDFYNGFLLSVGQIPSKDHSSIGTNNNGFDNGSPYGVGLMQTHKQTANVNDNRFDLNRVGQRPINRQTTIATYNNGFDYQSSYAVGQTTTTDQVSEAPNNNRFDSNNSFRVEQTPINVQTPVAINNNGFNYDPSYTVGQTTTTDQFSTAPNNNRFDSDNSYKVVQTATNGQASGNTNDNVFDNDSSSNAGPTQTNKQTEANVNNSGLDSDNSYNVEQSPNDSETPLALNNNEFDNEPLYTVELSTSEDQTTTTAPPKTQLTTECGVQSSVFNTALVGGEAAPEQYPWLALLEYTGGVVNCGGSLISRRHVLTAAYCLETMRGKPIAVRLSEYNMTTYPLDVAVTSKGERELISVVVVPVEWSRMHPLFGHKHYQHDIGLVKMAADVTYSDFIKPICLPQTDHAKEFKVDTNLLVAGWGTDSADGGEVKMDNQIPYVPMEICNRLVRRALGSKQMCAGERPTRKPCVADYGGPLMLETEDYYVAVGVVSYGPNQCSGGSVPDVYTNVYEYMDWIRDNVVDLDGSN